MDWFRMYHSILHDTKVLKLSPENRWFFVGFLAISSSNSPRGTLPDLEEIALELRVNKSKASRIVDTLTKAGFIEQVPGTTQLRVHGWDSRQFPSDDVTSRVQKHRGNVSSNVSRNVSETPSETETETEKKKSTHTPLLDSPPSSSGNGPNCVRANSENGRKVGKGSRMPQDEPRASDDRFPVQDSPDPSRGNLEDSEAIPGDPADDKPDWLADADPELIQAIRDCVDEPCEPFDPGPATATEIASTVKPWTPDQQAVIDRATEHWGARNGAEVVSWLLRDYPADLVLSAMNRHFLDVKSNLHPGRLDGLCRTFAQTGDYPRKLKLVGGAIKERYDGPTNMPAPPTPSTPESQMTWEQVWWRDYGTARKKLGLDPTYSVAKDRALDAEWAMKREEYQRRGESKHAKAAM